MSEPLEPDRQQIGRLSAADRHEFLTRFHMQRPVVLVGGLERWPETLFDLQLLIDRFGSVPVMSYRLPPEMPAARMSSIKSNFYMWSDEGGDRNHLRAWTFGEFISALRNDEPHYCMANRTKNTNLRDLLAAEAGDFDCMPAGGAKSCIAGREFFFGSQSAGPGLHHDGAVESFLCQLIGAKRVNVFSPSDVVYLYPAGSSPEPHSHFSSVADSFDPDLVKFPRFANATPLTCALGPGDALYIPPNWYHDTAPQGPTVSMTIRNTPPA
jgi:Cupin-like domain